MASLQDRLAAALAPRYTVDRELAAGGMGLVFLGQDPVLGREVAIKVLPPERATAVAVERFLREARLLARLAHPHVVPILEAQQEGDLLWFVMPRVTGDTLATRLKSGPLSAAEVRRFGVDLLDALAYAHAQGVIHRDIKPGNVFLQGDHALLADFGVALLLESTDDTLTETGQVIGTLRYMSPEQRSGEVATERSDMYGLAATLFEAATGTRWDPATTTSSGTWRKLPRRLAAVLRRALAPDPAKRWENAAEFRRALRRTGASPFRRAVLGTVGGFVVLVVAVVGNAWFGGAAHRPLGRYNLAVLPFDMGDTALGARIARRVTLALEWFPPVGSVARWIDVRRAAPGAQLGLAAITVQGTLLSRSPGHDEVMEIEIKDSLGKPLQQPIQVPGQLVASDAWSDSIAVAIVQWQFPRALVDFRQLSGSTHNFDAIRAFFAGQDLFARSEWKAAEDSFHRAASIDTTFLQATWSALLARQWQRHPFQDELAVLAKHADRLPVPLGALVLQQREPDLVKRIAGFDSLARAYPNYAPARLLQANELFHRGPLVGRPLQEGLDAFTRAAKELPELDQATTYDQTIWGAVRLGQHELASEQLAKRRARAPAGDQWGSLLRLAIEGRFRPVIAGPLSWILRTFASHSFVTDLASVGRLGLAFDNPVQQAAIGGTLERKGASGLERTSGLVAEATAALLLGQPVRALQYLDRAVSMMHGDREYAFQAAEWRVLLPLTGIVLADSERARGRQQLSVVPEGDALWPRAQWALAIDAIKHGDVVARDRARAGLHLRGNRDSVAADLALFVDAFVAGAAGRFDSALALSSRIHIDASDSMQVLRGPFVRALVYLERGVWQLNAGRPRDAEREWLWHENNDLRNWPDREPQQGEIDAALSGIARLWRAENLHSLGETSPACAMIDRVTELWRNAEPSYSVFTSRAAALRERCRS